MPGSACPAAGGYRSCQPLTSRPRPAVTVCSSSRGVGACPRPFAANVPCRGRVIAAAKRRNPLFEQTPVVNVDDSEADDWDITSGATPLTTAAAQPVTSLDLLLAGDDDSDGIPEDESFALFPTAVDEAPAGKWKRPSGMQCNSSNFGHHTRRFHGMLRWLYCTMCLTCTPGGRVQYHSRH